MDPDINPFHELYVTEVASPKEFAVLFSPFLVRHALPLFQQGNLVIKGSQGSGKSMLLSLLKPEIRCAYHKAGKTFPVPQHIASFIGAGINITRSGATNFGQRPLGRDPKMEEMLFPLYFSDFVNYWVVRDVLRSITSMLENPDAFDHLVCKEHLDGFARQLAGEDCWFGYLDGVRSYGDLVDRLDQRIAVYRRFQQFNLDYLPKEIDSSKTAVGEPISRTARCLQETRALTKSAPVLVRIDELHVLYVSDELRSGLGPKYKQVINKALGTRDPFVSYKIGTRSYAWDDNLTVFGTTASLERDRDFRIVDLDELLRRKENRKTWIFPGFARNVFARRLEWAGLDLRKAAKPLKAVMGCALGSEEAAERYAGRSDAVRALRIKCHWPAEWTDFLKSLYGKNKLSAMLAAAWANQAGIKGRANMLAGPPPEDNRPWERTYWRKERIRQALLQLATNCAQRLVWAGEDDILALSGGNILVFVSLCQHVWDAFLQSERGKSEGERTDPLHSSIEPSIQAVGIHGASVYWYEKIPEGTGGHDRQRFIDRLGTVFKEHLTKDRAMSYPGHNGFSLLKEEFTLNMVVRDFLTNAAEYGDLHAIRHTTKSKNRKQRIKWYLNPVLSPYFKIPESHVKEPLYVTVSQVLDWMADAEIPGAISPVKTSRASSSVGQLTLFEDRIGGQGNDE